MHVNPDQRVTDAVVNQLLAINPNEIDYSEFAQELVEAFGGVRKISRLIKEEYEKSEGGGMQRAQLLRYVLGVLEKHAQFTKGDPKRELALSREELMEEATAIYAEMQRSLHASDPAGPSEAAGGSHAAGEVAAEAGLVAAALSPAADAGPPED